MFLERTLYFSRSNSTESVTCRLNTLCLAVIAYWSLHQSRAEAYSLEQPKNLDLTNHIQTPHRLDKNEKIKLLIGDGWLQAVVSDGNGPVSRRQQITFPAALIFHLIDGLFSTTAAHEVRRAGVLTRGSRHLERSSRPHPHRGWSCQVPKTAEITLFSQAVNICWFLILWFPRCF